MHGRILLDRNEDFCINIQIFGTNKCFDTKKAIRYFKEGNIKYQFIDIKEKGLSKGEYNSVKQAVGGLEHLLNPKCKDKEILALIKYIADEDKKTKRNLLVAGVSALYIPLGVIYKLVKDRS